jgi:hypothetical protein
LTGQAFNQPQGQVISEHYVKPSALQQALPMINAGIGALTNANLDTKQAELAAALRGKQMELAQKYATAKTPQERMAAALDPNAPKIIQAAYAERLKPQKVGAEESLVSEDFGTGQLSPMYIGGPKLGQELKDSARQLGLDPMKADQWTPQQWGAVRQIEAQVIQSKRPVTNVYNQTESGYGKTFGEGVAKQDLALKDIAENSTKTIENIHNQKKLLDTGKVITGFGADQRLGLAQFGKAVGLTGKGDEDLASNTQNFLAGRAGSTLDAIQSSNLGSAQGFSNTDREFLQAAKLGGIKYDEKSLRRQLDLEERVARAATEKWNERVKSMPKSASIPINMTPIQLPGTYQMEGVDKSNPLLNPQRD